MKFLTTSNVVAIHDKLIHSDELPGIVKNRSIDAIVARIYNRIHYGLISDIYELAGCYATYIDVAHVFNDANKRTAFAIMDICLTINNISINYSPAEAGHMINKVAKCVVDEMELVNWLRQIHC